ncbi:MAG TPA: hypothetical protein VGN18_03260, partial [Jatrophihabitans sp.]|uniref:hypothetical protein n=1 Tax=Jatrophihabitans sp. TaxID=1932789 RepID=UPI002E065A0F|nr:hypothetical protein [Jatrophihabitans sp.]
GVPRPGGTVALVSITVVSPSRGGGITAWQSAVARPGTTTMQFSAGQEIVGTAAVPISASGYLNLFNASSGSVTVVVDVYGYVAPTTIPPAAPSQARYANDLHNVTDDPTAASDNAVMNGHGCADAQARARVVLLDLGTQSKTPDKNSRPHELGPSNPGVALALTGSATTDPVRIQYADLVGVLSGYLDGYQRCRVDTTGVTVAIGTNNDGLYSGPTGYPAATRGADWANLVIDPLASYASAHSVKAAVVGANDIEAAFSGTLAQAQQWEAAYFAATPASLIYNGDANSCPATFGVTGATCAFGWTQAQYYALAHNGSRTLVLPQIFFPAEAVKWADIDATGGGGLLFIGALTEHARVPSQLAPDQGRAALYRAVSSVVANPSVTYGIDLAADGN